jgi:pSer/pThr/pTyr-binding forkhead associated (FHA) protein
MQWDKFSTDSDESLRKLEAELLTATIDHINDKRYYTQAPVSLEVKPDYFTRGVKLYVSFDKNDANEREAQIDVHASEPPDEPAEKSVNMSEQTAVATFAVNGTPTVRKLSLCEGERLSIGRTKENDLAIDDISISKFHASLALAESGSLIIADTGSTNGTFVNGERIPYGKARAIGTADKLKLGSVEVKLELLPAPARPMALPGSETPTEAYKVGDFEFTSRTEQPLPQELVKEELERKNAASTPDSKDQAIEQTD